MSDVQPTNAPTGKPPCVSIIVATWNAASTLGGCIESILAQRCDDWELLVCDGGSNDGTLDIIRHYAHRIAWWRSERDRGIYDAWNRALDHARGRYVCFLGADDAWSDADALGSLAEVASGNHHDLVSARGRLVDASGNTVGTIGHAWNYRRLRRRIGICHPGALFSRSLFARFGHFDPGFRIVGDYEWLLRLPRTTSAGFVDRIVVDVGHGGVSRSQVWQRLRERREAHARSPRIGLFWAYVYWLDKLWRMPIARLLKLQY